MNQDLHTYDTLIAALYDAAMDPAKWQGFTDTLSKYFDNQSVFFHGHDYESHEKPMLIMSSADIDVMNKYVAHYWKTNPWTKAETSLHPGTVHHTDELFPARRLTRTEFGNDWLRTGNWHAGFGAMIARDGARFTALSVINDATWERHWDREGAIHLMKSLLPHLQRAVKIQEYLAKAEVTRVLMDNTLDQLGFAVFAVARDGRVIYANRFAEDIVSRNDGLKIFNSKLSTDDHNAMKFLSQSMASPILHGGVIKVDRKNNKQLDLLVVPANETHRLISLLYGNAIPTAFVFARDQADNSGVSADILRALHGFTVAEARLAASLVDGVSPTEYAMSRGVSINTVRSQIKSILDKTGSNRLTQLVSTILRGLSVIGNKLTILGCSVYFQSII